jgi:RNA polymerase sigma factor (sigma-70 family)
MIARNEALRILARRRDDPLPDDYEPAVPPAGVVTPEDRLAVRGALDSLNQDELRAVFLRYWTDQTEDQIAAAVNLPAGTVKIRLHRARKKLERRLGPVTGQG